MGVNPRDTDILTRMFLTERNRLDEEALEQRHCLVNILAVALGLPPDCSHVHTYTTAPERLVPGTALVASATTMGGHYDCGVVFDEDHRAWRLPRLVIVMLLLILVLPLSDWFGPRHVVDFATTWHCLSCLTANFVRYGAQIIQSHVEPPCEAIPCHR